MEKTIYFDHAAAMKPDVEVVDFYRQKSLESFANQEAGHLLGYEMRQQLKVAEQELADAVAERPMDVAWGDCGTTLFNMVTSLTFLQGGNVVISPLEHPAVEASLRRSGAEIRILPIIKSGSINWEKGAELLDKQTRLVVLFHVQSELGLLNDIDSYVPLIRELAPKARILADTIQSGGKLPLPKEVDMLTISGHKMGALGAGAILFDPKRVDRVEFEKMRHNDYRFGRIEVAQALTVAFAAKLRAKNRSAELEHVTTINKFLRNSITGTFELENSSPYILHTILPEHQSAIIMRILSTKGIYISSGSACTAESDQPSPSLLALGYKRQLGFSGLRISLSPSNTQTEATRLTEALNEAIKEY